jgi:hypothetical protein
MADVWAVSLQPQIVTLVAMTASPISIHSSTVRPLPEAIGKVVMLASLSMIVGCAKLAGFFLREGSDPKHEHPEADRLRRAYEAKKHNGPVCWVFENGIGFGEPIPVKASGGIGSLWTVPEKLHEALRRAWKTARERRT